MPGRAEGASPAPIRRRTIDSDASPWVTAAIHTDEQGPPTSVPQGIGHDCRLAQGAPEQVAEVKGSYTGQLLKRVLGNEAPRQ